MRGSAILDALSKRAPLIVAVTLCAALVSYWVEAPVWLPNGLAIVVGCLALVLAAARGRRPPSVTYEEEDSSSNGWIAQELAGKGTPPGFYLLEFFVFVTIMLTGFQGVYAMPSWAALALGAAWGISNARYTFEEGSGP
jgi:hypothetical protein